MKTALPLLLLLAGCAAPIPLELRVKQVSDVQVCEGVFFGPPQVAAVSRDEAQVRRIDCANYHALVIQQRQQQQVQQANQAEAFRRASEALQPRPPTFPGSAQCVSRRIGNTVRTDCN